MGSKEDYVALIEIEAVFGLLIDNSPLLFRDESVSS